MNVLGNCLKPGIFLIIWFFFFLITAVGDHKVSKNTPSVYRSQAHTDFHNGMMSLKMEDEENGHSYYMFMEIMYSICHKFSLCFELWQNTLI